MTWNPFAAISGLGSSVVKTVEGIPAVASQAASNVGHTISSDFGNIDRSATSGVAKVGGFFGGIKTKIFNGASNLGSSIGKTLNGLNPLNFFGSMKKYALYAGVAVGAIVIIAVAAKIMMSKHSYNAMKNMAKSVPGGVAFKYSGRR